MILESEQATLGQVAASWVWLRGIIEKLPSSENFSQSHQTQQLQKGCGHLWSKKTKGSLNIYNELNDDINDDDVSDEDNMDVDELMNDLGENN
ncbi:unnamed protein product [Rhizophagus irregularis]|nr:unnamed protein product [Rhizophagus irregularis]